LTATPTPEKQEITELIPYPNPYNPLNNEGRNLRIGFKIAQQNAGSISFRLYTVQGRLIRELRYEGAAAAQIAQRGYVECPREGLEALANGAYYYILLAESGGEATRSHVDKIIIMKAGR